jgi:anti-anti-sigma factor
LEEQHGSHLTVEQIELSGEFDLSRKDELRALLAHVDGTFPVVLDVREVTYGDSSFLSELCQLKARHPDCPMSIRGASPMMLKIFRLVKFDKLFTIEGCD